MEVANAGQVYEPVKEKLRLAALEINEDGLVSINSVYAFPCLPFIHLSCLFLLTVTSGSCQDPHHVKLLPPSSQNSVYYL